jgi:hypothetical protein
MRLYPQPYLCSVIHHTCIPVFTLLVAQATRDLFMRALYAQSFGFALHHARVHEVLRLSPRHHAQKVYFLGIHDGLSAVETQLTDTRRFIIGYHVFDFQSRKPRDRNHVQRGLCRQVDFQGVSRGLRLH